MRLISVGDNSLTCIAFDGYVTSGENVIVALPYRLRRSTYDGHQVVIPALVNVPAITVRYTYVGPQERLVQNVSSGFDENQAITPRYLVDDEILAEKMNFSVYSGSTIVATYEWIDSNIDGRAWGRL